MKRIIITLAVSVFALGMSATSASADNGREPGKPANGPVIPPDKDHADHPARPCDGDNSGPYRAEDCVPKKVTICHVPPGNPSNAHTITVGVSALPAHLAHGDKQGECPPKPPKPPVVCPPGTTPKGDYYGQMAKKGSYKKNRRHGHSHKRGHDHSHKHGDKRHGHERGGKKDDDHGKDRDKVKCVPDAPKPPTPPLPPAPPTPPAVVPPAAVTPPAATAAPTSATAPARRSVRRSAPARARLSTRASCASRTIRLTVRGNRTVRRVTVAINGRRVATRTPDSRTVDVTVQRRGNGVQRITVRATLGGRTQTIRRVASASCIPTEVTFPQFAG
jgi:hypothetical protein